MKKTATLQLSTLILITVFAFWQTILQAADQLPDLPEATINVPSQQPVLIPTPPHINAKSYVLIDANSGKIIASKNPKQRIEPASLTKMMTMYIVSDALKRGQLQLNTKIRISKKAWKTGGSRMFIRQGEQVSVQDLIHGVIVDSGNDACVALAEYIAGSEISFASLMNQQAQVLGMKDTHFVDSTGMPAPDHYTTAFDMAILARALVKQFPEYYPWYKQKSFTFSGIKQHNRNRLLWQDSDVDGIKTGHTDSAGYNLVASAKKNDMRLISVVIGTKSDNSRTENSQRLLTYGFRFYHTQKLYSANQTIKTPKLWFGVQKTLPIGVSKPLYVTIPRVQSKQLKASLELPDVLKAPIKQGDQVGKLQITLAGKEIATQPLIALRNAKKGSLWQRASDSARLAAKRWFSSNDESEDA